MYIKSKITVFLLIVISLLIKPVFATEQIQSSAIYPDYAYEFLGEDKYEKFNRKMFKFNQKLNKFIIFPVHMTWASIMPKYGMDRIKNVYTNIEYPKRLASSLLQKDFKATKSETLRFLANSTIGLGGLYDPAKSLFKIQPAEEDMEQALAKCKIKRGSYLVMPVLSSCSARSIVGKLLECPLDPSLYFASPITALVKFGLVVNKTAYMQPLSKMLEFTYADPYDITKKLYGIERYIKTANLDRENLIDNTTQHVNAPNIIDEGGFVTSTNEKTALAEVDNSVLEIKKEPDGSKSADIDNLKLEKTQPKIQLNAKIKDNIVILQNNNLVPDLILQEYNPQHPVVDSMRTALFDLPGVDESIWSEISLWNRSFSNRLKTDKVNITKNRPDYKYRYILQKDKNAPVAIIYPSIGEGIMSHHSVVFAKLFYDEGYSVIIQGSHFHWEFVNSMPDGYKPGIPAQDIAHLKNVTAQILAEISDKHKCKFEQKVLLGTSFGAFTTLFIADDEIKNNTLNINKYISINPPIELVYALEQLDENNKKWQNDTSNLKHKTATTAAKIVQLSDKKDEGAKIETLPFSEEEAKLITGFIMRQKLSDLIFSIENTPSSDKKAFYASVNNIGYSDYVEKYLLNETYKKLDDLRLGTSLHSIATYLQNNENYKIYHTMNDYFINSNQLCQLKKYSGNKLTLIDNGGHLGFLYRDEFINSLKKDISLKSEIAQSD